jgi:hypothetical protein
MGMRKLKFIRISNLIGMLLMFPGIYYYIDLPFVSSPYSYIIPISLFFLGFVVFANSAIALDSVKEEDYSKILPNDQIPIFFQFIFMLTTIVVLPATMFLIFSPLVVFIMGLIHSGDLQGGIDFLLILFEWKTYSDFTGLPLEQPIPPPGLLVLGIPSSILIVAELFCIFNNYRGFFVLRE